ncbi:hypothetical protein [Enhygromyxa salina]|uniref:Uncharacterized protein n=1 Tax=Enhygromyxa salina TaxID=215803 RepID=A0A2S9YDM4_9BACT|nr:hypothetical protein [Enhygromyxa salina]PRQ03227.1 hypothetical protein ENSA7_53040 [Enhygromyxa salina]
MDTEADDPFFLSRMLARLLASHSRLRGLEAKGAAQLFVSKERARRERYLDEVMALIPRERYPSGDGVWITMDSVLRAFRDEILIDLCRAPTGKELIGASVSVALRSRWAEAGAYGLPPEFLAESPAGQDEER